MDDQRFDNGLRNPMMMRVDLLASRPIEMFCKQVIEPRAGVALWNNGLGELVNAALADAGVPQGPVAVVDLARKLGILGPGGNR
jgi:hypothetical protein